MSEKPTPPPPPQPDSLRVAVIGGGIAGMTTAFKLQKLGFQVTLYEKQPELGGNVSSEQVNGVCHDVYPHMFCNWYDNFWALLQELGLDRDTLFEPREAVEYLGAVGDKSCTLENATTVNAVLANLGSGVLPYPDMFLWGYSMIDLAAHAFSDQEIDRLDVNGFLYSRGYTTDSVAKLHNYLLTLIWSIQSNTTAAASYQEFIRHTFTFPIATPFCWLLKGPLSRKIIDPFEQKLGCEVLKNCTVNRIALVQKPVAGRDGIAKPTIYSTPSDAPARTAADGRDFDFVVLATPAHVTAELVMKGEQGHRIVDQVPQLANLQHLQSVSIPVVDLYLTKKLDAVPKPQVGFDHSDFGLSVLDISQLWSDDPNMEGRTALVVAASDGLAIPSLRSEERGHLMITELSKAIYFRTGDHWGDKDSDIDWEKTHYRDNDEHKLFLNDVQSWNHRPETSYPGLDAVFFAGDCCNTDVDMATVEAAVQSGIQAAQAVQRAHGALPGQTTMGEPVTCSGHKTYSAASLLLAKLVFMPAAYWATAWAAFRTVDTIKEKDLGPNEYAPTTYTLMLPLRFVQDWWETVYWFAKNATMEVAGAEAAKLPGSPIPESDKDTNFTVTEMGARALTAAGQILQAIADQPRGQGDPRPTLLNAASELAEQFWRTVGAVVARAAPAAPAPTASPVRRARMKS